MNLKHFFCRPYSPPLYILINEEDLFIFDLHEILKIQYLTVGHVERK